MKLSVLLATSLVALSGCAAMQAVVPNTVTPEFEHMSHATQHQPFTNQPTNVGSELLNVVVGYELPHNIKLDIAEGIDLDKREYVPGYTSYGEIIGPREQFSLRVGYQFRIKQ
jgi:hypothetical protein